MNFLAHAYLSFQQPELLLGNMISDFVKGKTQYQYPPQVQLGITLHRSIDHFTDHHPATRAIKTLFRNDYRLYGGAFADIIYDHFLALDHTRFPEGSLMEFSQWVYGTLSDFEPLFPERFSRMFPFMKRDNWLYHYREISGIEKSFGGLVYRAKYLAESTTACKLFEKHYSLCGECYQQFFPELVTHTQATYHLLVEKLNTKDF